MLVVGGVTSLWGAVLGALAISGLDSFLGQAESGVNLGFKLDLPTGTRLVMVGALMALTLDPAAVGPHRRPRVLGRVGRTAARSARRRDVHTERRRTVRICIVGCGAVGSLFAANLANLDDVEVWAYDLDKAHVDAINLSGLQLTGAGEVLGSPPCDDRCRRVAAVRLRHRRHQGDAHGGRDRRDARTRSPTAPSRRCRTGSATRRRSRRTFHV